MDSCILTHRSRVSVNNEMHNGGIHLAASLSGCCQTVTLGTPVTFPIITRQNVDSGLLHWTVRLTRLPDAAELCLLRRQESYFFSSADIFLCDSQSVRLFGLAGHESLQVCSLVQARKKQDKQHDITK